MAHQSDQVILHPDADIIEGAVGYLCSLYKLKRSSVTVGTFKHVRDEATGEVTLHGTIHCGAWYCTIRGNRTAKHRVAATGGGSSAPVDPMTKQRNLLKKRNDRAKLDPWRKLV